jgi:hypothetical protein
VALAVDQNFGLTPPRAYRVANDEKTVVTAGDELTIIGGTRTKALRYNLSLLGIDAGIAHLGLTPVRDGYHNRLRELWIDTQTGFVREAIVQGVGDRPPFDRTHWHVSFTRMQGAMYLTEAHPIEPVAIGRTTPQISIQFEKLSLLSSSPVKTTFGIGSPVRYLRDP